MYVLRETKRGEKIHLSEYVISVYIAGFQKSLITMINHTKTSKIF